MGLAAWILVGTYFVQVKMHENDLLGCFVGKLDKHIVIATVSKTSYLVGNSKNQTWCVGCKFIFALYPTFTLS